MKNRVLSTDKFDMIENKKISIGNYIEIFFEYWVRHNGEPVLFATERGVLEYMHSIEMKTKCAVTEFELREAS